MIKKEMLVNDAIFYSPLSFLPKRQVGLGEDYLEHIEEDLSKGLAQSICSKNSDAVIYYRKLQWDTEYFGIPTYRVDFAAVAVKGCDGVMLLLECFLELQKQLKKQHGDFYLFAEIPSEDICTIQAAGLASWRLIETRLTYYRNDLKKFAWPKRSATRVATLGDLENLKETASEAKNFFDRFHADNFFFEQDVAARFLETFVENSVKGFADIVLVPDVDDHPPGAFLTAKYLENTGCLKNLKVGQMVLSAVSAKRSRWYVNLISEMSYMFKENDVDVSFMTTQSTNRSVIRVWEKLGYSFGKSSHVFACQRNIKA